MMRSARRDQSRSSGRVASTRTVFVKHERDGAGSHNQEAPHAFADLMRLEQGGWDRLRIEEWCRAGELKAVGQQSPVSVGGDTRRS